MCLVVVGFGVDPRLPLIVAANRDEFHARPAQAAAWWHDEPDILGGRDLQEGGSWLAIHRHGRFAAVTNFRNAAARDPALRSRGHLVRDFLLSNASPLAYLRSLDQDAYAGFNLLVSDGDSLAYTSNRGVPARELGPGIYGLSNAILDTPWSKVERAKSRLDALTREGQVDESALLELLADRATSPRREENTEHLSAAVARAITASFIVLPDYGTRCSTVMLAAAEGPWRFVERRFDAAGEIAGESGFDVRVD